MNTYRIYSSYYNYRLKSLFIDMNYENSKKPNTFSEEKRLRFKAVSTLVIAPREFSEMAVDHFQKSKEIDSLLSVRLEDLGDSKRISSLIPDHKIRQAKQINTTSKVSLGFVMKYLHDKLYPQLNKIPDNYRLLCQVETPVRHIKKYKNIDIGTTSNGKIEKFESLMQCSIRETFEEAQIQLDNVDYCPMRQMEKRQVLDIDLPISIVYKNVLIYILII